MTLVEYYLPRFRLKMFEIDTCQMFVNIQHYSGDPSSIETNVGSGVNSFRGRTETVAAVLHLREHGQDGGTDLLRVGFVRVHLHHGLYLVLGEDAGQMVVQTAPLILQLLMDL